MFPGEDGRCVRLSSVGGMRRGFLRLVKGKVGVEAVGVYDIEALGWLRATGHPLPLSPGKVRGGGWCRFWPVRPVLTLTGNFRG